MCGVLRQGIISLLLKNSICIGNFSFSYLLLSLCWQPTWVTVPITPDAKNSKTLYVLENLLCIVRKQGGSTFITSLCRWLFYLECIHFIETANWAQESEVAHIANGGHMLFEVHLTENVNTYLLYKVVQI